MKKQLLKFAMVLLLIVSPMFAFAVSGPFYCPQPDDKTGKFKRADIYNSNVLKCVYEKNTIPVYPESGTFFTGHDPVDKRLWMLEPEKDGQRGTNCFGPISPLARPECFSYHCLENNVSQCSYDVWVKKELPPPPDPW